jgi:hypothetical protein
MREEYLDSLQDRRYLSLEAARRKKATLDWAAKPPVRPNRLGTFYLTQCCLLLLLLWPPSRAVPYRIMVC